MVSNGEKRKTSLTVENLCREISITPYAKRYVKSGSYDFENKLLTYKSFFLYEHNKVAFMLMMRQETQSSVTLTRIAFSANEVAEILGVSRATIYRMVALEEIRPIAHNGVYRFSQKEIDRYLANTMEIAA